MKKKYFSMEKAGQTATINIYGDITSWAWEEFGEVSAVNLSKQLETLGDVDQIDVFINSYGGEVAEGLAIFTGAQTGYDRYWPLSHPQGYPFSGF